MLNLHDAKQEAFDPACLHDFDAVVVGAGFAGAVVARELAERGRRKVAIIERRATVGGNAYDEYDQAGVLVHRYGPHIFHSKDEEVFVYLSRFTDWLDYQHRVLADIYGKYTEVPFNLNSIEQHFSPSEARAIRDKLIDTFGEGTKVPIIELREQKDALLEKLADFVYKNVFLFYTQKQWGLTPEQLDPSVTGRVPVLVGRDDRYFTDPYQGMPALGYTKLFERLLDHAGIEVFTNLDARDLIQLQNGAGELELARELTQAKPFQALCFAGRPYRGQIVFTGALDSLCNTIFGLLPYRSLQFECETHQQKHLLPCGTVNYTVSQDYTRITEYTYMTGQDLDVTTIMKEYSLPFTDPASQIPYYAVISDANQAHYQKYLDLFASLDNFHVLGRLAEYRYFNMDEIVRRALDLSSQLL
ncbi:MAG: UDP-galactopyranose mutase [Coriobacteriales bacterium]|jgi:UDP-galactopyranose mutase|nr:UDP-galactopyranose mutase [Coriobacteriales bacterium]